MKGNYEGDEATTTAAATHYLSLSLDLKIKYTSKVDYFVH